MYRTLSLSALILMVAATAFAGAVEDQNKALTQKFYDEVANKGNMAAADQLLAEDFVDHEPFPGIGPGRDGCKQFFSMMRSAFPDLKFEIKQMIAEGDRVAVFVSMTGTHKGDFMGMPPSGRAFKTDAIDIIRIADGKAVEHWGVTDGMTMMQQLGAMPGMPEHNPPGKK